MKNRRRMLWTFFLLFGCFRFASGGTDNLNMDFRIGSLFKDFNAEWTWRRSGMLNMDLSFGEAIILAREEAKCLLSFGQRKISTDFAENEYSPFVCSPSLTNFMLCEQCRELTKRKSSWEDCQNYCGNNDTECQNVCASINFAVDSESWEIDSRRNKTEFRDFNKDNLAKVSQSQSLESGLIREKNGSLTEQSFPLSYEEKIRDRKPTWNYVVISPQVFCEGVTFQDEDTFTNGIKDKYSSVTGSSVGNISSSYSENLSKRNENLGENHFALLKWSVGKRYGRLRNSTKILTRPPSFLEKQRINSFDEQTRTQNQNDGIQLPDSYPLVFVIESFSEQHSKWITVAKTTYGLQTVDVAYYSDLYKWRITAVGPLGILDDAITEDYTTLDGYTAPSPPQRIYVVQTSINENSTNVLIGWDPPKEKGCFYKVVLQSYDGDDRPYKIRIKEEPLGVHQYWFENLRFGTQYSVRITTKDPMWQHESALTELIFRTPTCLQSHNYRFDKCEPPAPRDISATLESKKSGDNRKLVVTLKWQPPLNTSKSNPIEKYLVELTAMSLRPQNHRTFSVLNSNSSSSSKGNGSNWHNQDFNFNTTIFKPFTVHGNTTRLILENLRFNTDYTAMITAYSSRGASPTARFHLSTKPVYKDEHTTTPMSNWLYLTIPIFMMTLVLLSCHFARQFFQKRAVKLARNQYFQSMEERDAMSADWSIVPLTEESSHWKLLDDSFPKDKWEIVYENLIMGEVIGQGAFGVVRTAKIPRTKLKTKLKRHGGNDSGSGRQYDGSSTKEKESDADLETVAVKMLKVSATREDRDQLIKEIVTMQNLGCHPQIVGLLGACTKGRTLCLVLEYCPGGDLLTFLRKVRAKYWPTLGLTDNRDSSLSPIGSKTNTNSSNRKSFDSSPINYADIGSFSEYSSSPDKNQPGYLEDGNTKPDKGENQSQPTSPGRPQSINNVSLESEDECRPIDEKDVLSYARQIAMGMEYLEKNRVVHRDLAGRNVLLLGDYKQVKISDFGLSRDVYTWNVYHQKSNGKLPIKWMAIESIFTHVFTSKSDIWSYGILLWELVTLGGTPYPGLGNTELFHLLKSGYRMERPDNCSEELYALMKKCWRTAPAARPNFTEMRHHLETMMEAAEPNLYLSLRADIPTDYFHLSSRSDLLGMKTPSRDNVSLTRYHSDYRRRQNSYPHSHNGTNGASSHHRSSGTFRSIPSPLPRAKNGETVELGIKKDNSVFFSPYGNCSSGSNLNFNQIPIPAKRLSLDLNVKMRSKSYLSPDSGIQRSEEVGLPEFCDHVSCGDDDAIELEFEENGSGNCDETEMDLDSTNDDCFPLQNITVNNMTIIENKSYDLAD